MAAGCDARTTTIHEAQPLLSAKAGDKKLTGPSLAKNYHATEAHGGTARWRHFTQRGHRGPVQALASSAAADFIVTGGVDYSVRVFEVDYTYEAFALVAVFDVPVPQELVTERERQGCIGYFLGSQPSVDWKSEPDQGVSALTMVSSRRSSKIETTTHLDPKETRMGPIVVGTAHGSVYLWDLSVVKEKERSKSAGVTSLSDLHKDSKVNDLCMLPLYTTDKSTGTEVMVMTAGQDKKACLLQLFLEEVDKPVFEEIDVNGGSHWLIDLLFKGAGSQNLKEIHERDAKRANKFLKYQKHEIKDEIKHDEPVLMVSALTHQTGEDEVSFCSLTTAGVHLFTWKGQKLITLRIDTDSAKMCYNDGLIEERNPVKVKKHTNLATTAKTRNVVDTDGNPVLRNQSLILVSGEEVQEGKTVGWVAVWGIENGIVGNKTKQGFLTYKHKNAPNAHIEPLCCYKRDGIQLDVDQSGLTTTFAAQLSEDRCTVQIWNTEAVFPGKLVADPVGPSSVLICPGYEALTMDLEHPAQICKLKVVEDELGPALITACESATAYIWDLEGDDKEQIYAELRSLSPLEIFVTPALLIITALQMIEFAFVAPVKSGDAAKHHIHKPWTLVGGLHGRDEDTFWWEMYIFCTIVVCYQMTAFLGLPERLDKVSREAGSNPDYIKEKSEKPCWRPWAIYARLVAITESVVCFFVQIFSTVAVVPTVKILAHAIVCGHIEEHKEGLYLLMAPDIECFKGPHLQLLMLLLLIVPGYCFCLVPYAVVAGDASYVPNKTLFEYRFWHHNNPWRNAAARKATNVHLAFMHMSPKFAFWTLFIELLGKVSMPLAAVWFKDNALVQTSCVAFIGFVMWISPLIRAPYVERKFNVLLQALKLISFLAMATGLFTVIENQPESPMPLALLAGGTAVVLIMLTIQLCTMKARKRPVAVFEHEPTNQDAEAK